MLKEFLQSISGPVSNIAYTFPSSNGINGPSVTAGGVFTKLLNVLSNGAYSGGNSLSNYTTMLPQQQSSNPAVQAYLNSLNTYTGVTNSKASKREAFSPGSVINSLQAPPMPQAVVNPYGQLTAAINPLQGFANSQTGIGGIPGASFTGALGATGSLIQPGMIPGQNGFSPMGFGASGFGKWSMFLMPLISLVGLVKSFFGLGGIAGSGKPALIDRDTLAYQSSFKNYVKEEHTEGNFDEGAYWGEDEGGESGLDSSKLEM